MQTVQTSRTADETSALHPATENARYAPQHCDIVKQLLSENGNQVQVDHRTARVGG